MGPTHTSRGLQLASMSLGTSRVGINLTRRMQSTGVQAMVRHYIGNEGETGRQWTSSNIDDR